MASRFCLVTRNAQGYDENGPALRCRLASHFFAGGHYRRLRHRAWRRAGTTAFPGKASVTLKSRAMPLESDHAPIPGTIYKYTDRIGVEKILSNRMLRFARPSEMNDPFDIYIEDLLGMDLEEVHERAIDIFSQPC
jgi:hypothetical protein